jgi:hypothetical protein
MTPREHTLENQPPPPADNPFTPFWLAHRHEGSTYQPGLRAWLKEHPDIVTCVETGSGCSTCYMALAMDERGGPGRLFSIDPGAWCGYSVDHPRVRNIRESSLDALVPLYLEIGAFDLFLHDGHHELLYQAFDIAIGFACLRPGGWMWCDDYTWNEHHAWKRFAAEHGLELHDFGSASAVQKPLTRAAMDPALIEDFAKYTRAKFTLEDARWQAAGGKYSGVFGGENGPVASPTK